MRSSRDPASPLGPWGDEVQILRYPRAIPAKDIHVPANPLPGLLEIVIVQVDVEKIPVARTEKLLILLREQPFEETAVERVAGVDPRVDVFFGEGSALVQPLPEDAEANFTRRHVLHQVQHVVVPEEIGGLERGGLQPLLEGVAGLQSD